MFIIFLLILYIVITHIYLANLKIKYDDLKIKYVDLKIKYDSKQWVYNIAYPLVRGMIAGYNTNSFKYKK